MKLLMVMGYSALLLSSCGPSGGKALATDSAIRSLKLFQQAPSRGVLESTRHAIIEAKAAGDPARKADVQLSMDLDDCALQLSFYSAYFDGTVAYEKAKLDEGLSYCIRKLQKDLN